MLAAPHPLLLHNTGENFPTDALRSAYRAMGASDKLRVVAARLPDEELVKWICAERQNVSSRLGHREVRGCGQETNAFRGSTETAVSRQERTGVG